MKFEHSLKFNVVPEWQDNYLNYSVLKKTIYRLQQQLLESSEESDQFGNEKQVPTTVTELVERQYWSKSNKNSSSTPSLNAHHSEISEETQNEENGKLSMRFLSKLKKITNDKKTQTVDEDLEANVGASGRDAYVSHGYPTEKSKSDSIKSFTVELEDSTIQSFIEYSNSPDASNDVLTEFTRQLLQQLTKIDKFYMTQESKIFKDYENLLSDLERNKVDVDEVFKHTQAYGNDPLAYEVETILSRKKSRKSMDLEKDAAIHETHDHFEDYDDDDDDDDEDDDEYNSTHNSALFDHTHFQVEEQKRIALKKKSTNLFIELSELKSFIELNRIGFTKICKKFDKTCNYSIKQDFVQNFLPSKSKVFAPSTINNIDVKLNKIIKIYALLIDGLSSETSHADLNEIRNELKSHLRDHIVWERNTVWKDLLSMEKKSYNLEMHRLTSSNKMGDESEVPKDIILHLRWKTFNLPFTVFGHSHMKVPASLLTTQIIKLAIIIAVFVILMTVKTMNDPEEHRALAVLVTCALLWASEAIPLYITALLVPLLTVTCKVLKNEDGTGHMNGPDSSAYIFSKMWSSVIMLLLGGFTIAAALSKYNIAKVISSYILAIAGTKPRNVLLAIMCVSLFLSMWISNVAAPVLCFSLIQPVLRTLPTESPFAQALVLGIALASNVAGMASPIASPQNMIAIEAMVPNPGWGKWFAVALPVSIVAMLLIWLELIFTFKISDAKVKAYKPITDRFTVKQIYVSIVTVGTIILWCVMTKLDNFFGESGIVSIIPILLFFGPGLLKTEDLNNFPWNIVVLAMGGIALGKAISSSGLLKTIAEALQKKVMNYEVFVILLIFGLLVLVIATFISHTVAALIIIPLVQEVGESLPTPHPQLLVMGTALLASAAMGLPTSGFPNVTAISMTDEVGKPYLTVNTFITRGVPASLLAYITVITLGYGIMTAVGF